MSPVGATQPPVAAAAANNQTTTTTTATTTTTQANKKPQQQTQQAAGLVVHQKSAPLSPIQSDQEMSTPPSPSSQTSRVGAAPAPFAAATKQASRVNGKLAADHDELANHDCTTSSEEDEYDEVDEHLRRSSVASFAQQYLLQRTTMAAASGANCHQRAGSAQSAGNSCGMEQLVGKQRRRLKQMLQSIPVPHLVATSIIAVIMMCLLLSECKSLQWAVNAESQPQAQLRPIPDGVAATVGGDGAMALLRQVDADEHESPASSTKVIVEASEQAAGETQRSDSQVSRGIGGRSLPLQRRHHHQRLLILDSNTNNNNNNVRRRKQHPALEQVPPSDDLFALQQQQAGLKREILAELIQQQQQQQHHHQLQNHQHQTADKRHSSSQQDGGDSLAALLSAAAAAAAAASSSQPQPGAGPEDLQVAEQVAPATVEQEGDGSAGGDRPVANLRNSPLELIDLSGHSSQHQYQPASQYRQHNNQHLSQELATSNNKYRQPMAYQQPQQFHHHNQQQQHQTLISSKPAATASNEGDGGGGDGGDELARHRQSAPATKQPPYLLTPPLSMANDRTREFDVPQIQCNNTDEGFERFACPTPDEHGYRCIEDRLFCDGYYDCPGGEDEDRISCMYYKLNRQMAHRSMDLGLA